MRGPVPCPRRHNGGRQGKLYPQDSSPTAKWVCTICRHVWSAEHIDALIKARAHVVVKSKPEEAQQLSLEDHVA